MKRKLLVTAMATAMVFAGGVYGKSLKDTVKTAIESYPEVSIALNRYQASREAIDIARSAFRPSLDLSYGIGYEETDSPTTRTAGADGILNTPDDNHKTDIGRNETALVLSQLVFDSGRTANDIKRVTQEAKANGKGLAARTEDVALEAVRAYLEVLKAQQVMDLAEENFASHKRINDQISRRTERGLGSSSDLAQSVGRLARARSNVIAAQNNLLDADAQYYRVVGEMPEILDTPADISAMLPPSLTLAMQQADSMHPTLHSAALDIKAASSKVDLLRGNYGPRVTFELGGSWNDDVDGTQGHNNDLFAMLRMNYNLYAGGGDRARIQEASYQLAEAKDVHQQAYRDVHTGLMLSWNAYRALEEQLIYLNEHVVSSRETLSAYQKQFDLGRRTLMDLLDMENEVFEATRSKIVAEVDLMKAKFRILNATGQLTQALEVNYPQYWQVQ